MPLKLVKVEEIKCNLNMMHSSSALSAKEDMMGATFKCKLYDALSQSSSTEDDPHKERGEKSKRKGKALRKKKNITKLTHRPPVYHQPPLHLKPHPLHPVNLAKTRIKPRKGMQTKSRNSQEVCILNVLTVIVV